VNKEKENSWMITIDDGFCEYQYPVEISDTESIDSVITKIRELFKKDKQV